MTSTPPEHPLAGQTPPTGPPTLQHPPFVAPGQAPGSDPAAGHRPGNGPATGLPATGLQAPPPTGAPVWTTPPAPAGPGGRNRPWWGMGDLLLALPVILGAALLGGLLGLPFVALDDLTDATTTPLAVLVTSLYGQQLGQGLWPVVVAKWKGLGPVADWRLRFRWWDVAIGLGTAVIAVGLSAVVSQVVSSLVGLTDAAEANNTQFLVDAEGTLWLWFLLIGVVIGAPLAEELFFRGLVLRAIEKRAGQAVAVLGSTVIFTLPHYTGAGPAGTLVLFSSIATIGLVLAVVAVAADRIGPTIIAHALFNAVGAAGALGLFGDLAT